MPKRKRESVVALMSLFMCLWGLSPLLITPNLFSLERRIRHNNPVSELGVSSNVADNFGVAPVIGTYALVGTSNIETVYAIPSNNNVRGIALLLHACTHNALKFFSPSAVCNQCIGLSEELRISRILLARGYAILAITSKDRRSGCWANHDKTRIREALTQFQAKLALTTPGTEFMRSNTLAIGASSGGRFAAELAADGVAKAALVTVMSLGPLLRARLASMGNAMPKVYLATMPRDLQTTQATLNDFEVMTSTMDASLKDRIIFDSQTCGSLPLTTDYIHGRVPYMRQAMADKIVQTLSEHKFLDSNLFFIQDPTISNWRNALLQSCGQGCLEHQNLAPGLSPLAKALHRAWAFHEYCSEVIEKALDFFESKTSL